MWWAIIKCVCGFFIGIVLSVLFSGSVQAWPQSAAPKFIVSNTKVTHPYMCNGEYQDIRVNGQGAINACVMGGGIKVASYKSIDGVALYAIAFTFDDEFYPLNVCITFRGCSYSELNDTFVGFSYTENLEVRGKVYKDFAKNLVKTVRNGAIQYGLSERSPSFEVLHPAGLAFYAQNLATSTNGEWSLFEIRDYGYYRVNNQTFEVRRVVAPGNTYSVYGSNPSVELAISNDGKTVAIMGEKMSFSVVVVNDTCGDRLSPNIQTSYVGAVTACKFLNTNPSSYVSNYMFASKPQFSQDSKRLTFDLYPYMSETKKVTLFAENVDTTSQYLSQYMAIGDSFVSGEGETDDALYVGGATNKCHVSLRSYPYLLGVSWKVSAHNAACSGATTETAKSKRSDINQLTQLEEVESRLPQLLTIGIGGNDAGLMGKLKTCIGIGTCEWASTAAQRANTAEEIKKLYPRLKGFYSTVQSKNPGKVVVIGYPLIISTDTLCFAGVGSLLDQTERRFINEGIKYLNLVVKAAANDSGIDFVDTENALAGSELCSLNFTQSMNGLHLGDDYPALQAFANIKVFGAESFHPNPTGHQKIAQKILASNSNIFTRPECITCDGYIGVPDPAYYWGSGVVEKYQNAFAFLSTATVKEGGLFEISFPAMSFAAGTDVTIEMHSTTKVLGKFKTAQDGSLKVTVKAINFEAGYHSIHVLSKNTTGNDVDVYDFLAVEDTDKQPSIHAITTNKDQTPSSKPASKLAQPTKVEEDIFIPSVMGVATMPVQKMPPLESKKLPASMNKNNSNDVYYGIAVISVVTLVVVAAIVAYKYYRQKQARYRKG